MSKRIIIDINDKYDDIMAITLIGARYGITRATTRACDLQKHTYFAMKPGDDTGRLYEFENEEATMKAGMKEWENE